MKDNQSTQKSTITTTFTNEIPRSIVVFGAESSGKSTLTKELTSYYNVFSNPEFSRFYLETKMKYANYEDTNSLTFDDVEPIAIGQLCSENQIKELVISHNQPFYFLDTNLLTTFIYSKHIYKKVPFWLEKAIQNQKYSHYLLLKPNTKWEFDKQRGGEEGRLFFYEKMKEELESRKINYSEITELNEKRLEEAIKIVDFLLK
jgi:NadR type nicotinamide-nucleotide adenylyltransferase